MFNRILEQLPYIGKLRTLISDQGQYLAGHYHSPIPAHGEVVAYLERTQNASVACPDVRFNEEKQFELLRTFQTFYGELPFPENQTQNSRYYFNQVWFRYADAVFLYSFLRHAKPTRIVEVGSGFSSAVILDTVDRFFAEPPKITFIEPFPARVEALLTPEDHGKVTLLVQQIQAVPMETFTSLRSGDFLFIDSSHVIKCGSDVHYLMFEVLPRLPAGIFVHFHDIFYPFEYPAEWLLIERRYWNETYFLRAFLAYNADWEIYFFNNYVGTVFKNYLADNMPICLKDIGGSLYIRRSKTTSAL